MVRGALKVHKVKTLTETPLPPPPGSVTQNIFFLLLIWALGTMKWILRSTCFFPHKIGMALRKNHLLPYTVTSKSEFF